MFGTPLKEEASIKTKREKKGEKGKKKEERKKNQQHREGKGDGTCVEKEEEGVRYVQLRAPVD